MKTVCILINTLLSGGAEKQSIYLAHVLSKNYNTQLIVFNGDKCDSKLLVFADKYNILPIRLRGRFLSRLYYLYKIFNNDVNIVFAYLPCDNLLAALIGKITGIQTVIGGVRISSLPSLKFNILRYLHNSSLLKYTIFNNYSGAKYFINKGFNPKKSVVIHNTLDNQHPIKQRVSNSRVVITTICRFAPNKDHKTALHAISKLIEKHKINPKDFIYRIVGYGRTENIIRELVKNCGLEDCVEIVINPNNVAEYFENSDIYLSTSINDGISNSIMEAMSFALPIVATEAGDNQFLVKHRVNGFLSHQKDSLTIGQFLYELIVSPSLRTKMGKESYGIIKNEFSLENFQNKYLEFMKELSNKKKSPKLNNGSNIFYW